MDKKQRFFIYDSKEVILLVVLAMGVAAFAFTLGIHLGKKVLPTQGGADSHGHKTESSHLEQPHQSIEKTEEDTSGEPSRFDLSENAASEEQKISDELSKKLHEERERTGTRLETPMDTTIPEKTLKEKNDPTAQNILNKIKKIEQPAQGAPKGRFTLQVGSFTTNEEANTLIEKLKRQDLQPFTKEATVGNQKWFRVYVGGYPSMNAAQEIGAKMKQENKIESFLVSKMPE